AALLLAAAPALVWGEQYAEFGRRLLAAWESDQQPDSGPRAYTFRVMPSEGFAAKGRPLALLVLVPAPHPDLQPAPAAPLAHPRPEGKRVRVPMTPADRALPALGAAVLGQAGAPLGGVPLAGTANLLSGSGPRTRAFTFRFDRLAGDLAFHVEA